MGIYARAAVGAVEELRNGESDPAAAWDRAVRGYRTAESHKGSGVRDPHFSDCAMSVP